MWTGAGGNNEEKIERQQTISKTYGSKTASHDILDGLALATFARMNGQTGTHQRFSAATAASAVSGICSVRSGIVEYRVSLNRFIVAKMHYFVWILCVHVQSRK